MLFCPNCESELEEYKGRLICSNYECNYVTLLNTSQAVSTPWYKMLCEEEAYWYKPAFESFPSIIAHEYWRLFDMLEKGQTFGSLLQLKDLFEVIIKFPILIAASHMYYKKQRSDTEGKIILSLLEKQLSLGHWKQIAQTIASGVKVNPPIDSIIKNSLEVFEDIPAWRNENIGHGALTYDHEKLQKDIKSKLIIIKQFLEKNEKYYNKISLYIDTSTMRKILIGKENARNIEEIGELFVACNGCHQKLYPYILLEEKKIFFFDSYSKYNDKTTLLNYPEGIKKNTNKEINQEMKKIFSSFSQSNLLSDLRDLHSIEDDSYSLIEEEILHKIQEIDDFQKPIHLDQWIKQVLKDHNKGIFLLQMERGTGKTTFSRSLDERSIHTIKLSDISVRGHYINDSYSYKLTNFFSNILFRLKENEKGTAVISKNFQISEDVVDKKESFARLLNEYRNEHQKYFGKNKLLLILDGLDEIPLKYRLSIFDFIPSEDMLDDHVYLLLTSRTDDELSRFTKTRLKDIKPTHVKIVHKEEKENVETLRYYVCKYIIGLKDELISKEQENFVNKIVEQAENRFIYLKLLKELHTVEPAKKLFEYPKGEELFDLYFETLGSMYGEKFFQTIINLLSIISTSYEPLTYREVSTLMGEDKTTFKLLAFLSDIRGFVKIERSYRGNMLSVSHEDWKKSIKRKYKNSIMELITIWVNSCSNLAENMQSIKWTEAEFDGWTYLVTYLHDYIEDNNLQELDIQELHKYYKNVVKNQSLRHRLPIYQINRKVHLYTQHIHILKDLMKKEILLDESNIASALEIRGIDFDDLGLTKDALKDYDEAVEIRRKMSNKETLVNLEVLAGALINRGVLFSVQRFRKKAFNDYNEAVEIYRTLEEGGRVFDKNGLALALSNRGNSFYNRKEGLLTPEEELEKIKLGEEGVFLNKDRLAATLVNIGDTLSNLDFVKKALIDINEAIEILRTLKGEGNAVDESILATAILSRGSILEDIFLKKEASEDYKEAVTIQKRLAEMEKLDYENHLANALNYHGSLSLKRGKSEEALHLLNEAVEIKRRLVEEGKLLDETELASILTKRGSAFSEMKNYTEALKDYNEAVEIQKKLREKGKLLNENQLAYDLLERAEILTELKLDDGLLNDYNESINIYEKLSLEGKSFKMYQMARGLFNRAILLWEKGDLIGAWNDYNQVVLIDIEWEQQGYKRKWELADIFRDEIEEEPNFDLSSPLLSAKVLYTEGNNS